MVGANYLATAVVKDFAETAAEFLDEEGEVCSAAVGEESVSGQPQRLAHAHALRVIACRREANINNERLRCQTEDSNKMVTSYD